MSKPGQLFEADWIIWDIIFNRKAGKGVRTPQSREGVQTLLLFSFRRVDRVNFFSTSSCVKVGATNLIMLNSQKWKGDDLI